MVKTNTFDATGYRPVTGIASGSTQERFKFESFESDQNLSFVQLPLIPGTKADFLDSGCRPQLGTPPHLSGDGSRIPWWSVLAQLEQCGSTDGPIHFENALGIECQTSIRAVFSDIFRKDINPYFEGKYVFTIPNHWEEAVQDKFLQFLPCDRNKAHLLWRPVAMLMACLGDQIQSSAKTLSGKSVLVLDFGNCFVEATRLQIKMDRGCAVPVRQNLKPGNSMRRYYHPADWLVASALKASATSPIKGSLLLEGFASELLSQTKPKAMRFFAGNAGAYQQINLSASGRDELLKEILSKPALKKNIAKLGELTCSDTENMQPCVGECLRSQVFPWIKETGIPDIVVVGGVLSDVMLSEDSIGNWIVREFFGAVPALKKSTVLVVNKNSTSKGALLYGQREQLGLPTYFDVLPKYEVYVLQRKLGEMPRVGATELVANVEVRGGDVWKPQAPIEGFSIRARASRFELSARREDEEWKSIPADEFPQLEQDEPVLIYPEMRPASGYAVVTIRPKDNPEIFGKKQELVLRWNKGVDKNPEPLSQTFAYPFVDWTEGRFAKDLQVQEVIRRFVQNRSRRVHPSPLTTSEIGTLEVVMDPAKNNPGVFFLPSCGAFGNQKFGRPFDRELVEEYAEKLFEALLASPNELHAGSPQQKTIRLLGFMYSYTPKRFRDYLKGSFRSGYVPSMNEIIASGRTFKTEDEVNSLLEYITSLSGLPETDLGWYWWALFRCMFYNPTAANADYQLSGRFYQKMVEFLSMHQSRPIGIGGGPGSLYNQHKFCLCAILYGLRLREIHPNFISKQSRVYKDLESILSTMRTRVTFNSIMNAIPPDRRPLARKGLQGIVLDFLRGTASKDMVDLLADFTHTLT